MLLMNKKTKRIMFVIWLVIAFFPVAFASNVHPEAYYQDKWCSVNKGQTEYRLEDNTRVDCLTDTHAIEFDFAEKWAESIGQVASWRNVRYGV
jgi:hypothetical protein